MKIVKRKQAVIDVIETADFISQDNLEIAHKFLDAFEATLERIKSVPEIGTLRQTEAQPNLRMWFVEDFSKCLIFYAINEEAQEIEIIRVIHSSRDYTKFFG